MKKQRFLLIILLIIFGIAGISLAIFNFLVPKMGGLLIETSPTSTVYINGEEVGRTPYTGLRKPGQLILRLIPDSFGTPLSPFEEKVNIISGVETVVKRYFGISDDYTEGEILSFEKLQNNNIAAITVVTDPENVQIVVKGVDRGVTPYTSQNIESGVANLKLSAVGYKDREVEVNLVKGYRLISFIKLSKLEVVKKVEETENKPLAKVVKILDTPTGFLRVRKEASSSALEVGRVKVGEQYNLMEESTGKDWFKISPEEGVTGWVTSQYSELITKDSASESAETQ